LALVLICLGCGVIGLPVIRNWFEHCLDDSWELKTLVYNWFAHQVETKSNWFDIEHIWFELGLNFPAFGLQLVL
jgi:hypothetical protein